MRILSIVASMIANNVRARREAAIQRQLLEHEILRLRQELEGKFRPENIIGNSSVMRDVYRQIQQVANSNTTILIRGESGTGKICAGNDPSTIEGMRIRAESGKDKDCLLSG